MTDHCPLHRLGDPGRIRTAGRVERGDGGWTLGNAHSTVPLLELETASEPRAGALAQVEGHWNGRAIEVESLRIVHLPDNGPPIPRPTSAPPLADVVSARACLRDAIRDYFEADGFHEVVTPHAVPAPGTDLHLEPVGTRSLEERDRKTVEPYLHTSPEFAMKRLLAEGFERIYQLARVWRDGEVTDLHHPEFSLLEWYRAWESLDAVMADCEELVARACGANATVASHSDGETQRRTVSLDPPFDRITMRELVHRVAGFDLLECLEYEQLRRAIVERDLLAGDIDRRHPPQGGRWDDLFFELMVAQLEPRLAEMGAVFVTEWPAPLAILARTSEDDPRVARRFELYVGGVELANGFDELTDPDEQTRRFEEELEERTEMGRPQVPMPEQFLTALEYGLPPSSGVALGVDRLLMLALGLPRIDAVAPLARRRMDRRS